MCTSMSVIDAIAKKRLQMGEEVFVQITQRALTSWLYATALVVGFHENGKCIAAVLDEDKNVFIVPEIWFSQNQQRFVAEHTIRYGNDQLLRMMSAETARNVSFYLRELTTKLIKLPPIKTYGCSDRRVMERMVKEKISPDVVKDNRSLTTGDSIEIEVGEPGSFSYYPNIQATVLCMDTNKRMVAVAVAEIGDPFIIPAVWHNRKYSEYKADSIYPWEGKEMLFKLNPSTLAEARAAKEKVTEQISNNRRFKL